jgi:hypothetical protein
VIVSLKDCTALYFSAQKYANDELLISDRSSLRSALIALINLVDMEKGKELLSGTAFQSFRGGPAAFQSFSLSGTEFQSFRGKDP